CSSDLDGVEGSTYVWTPAQLAEVLGDDDGARAAELLGVTETGTFEAGSSTLRLVGEVPAQWPHWREELRAARDRRVQPDLDDKVVTSWNALAILALAGAGALLAVPEWVTAAKGWDECLWPEHAVDGAATVALCRSAGHGRAGAAAGVADDYGDLAAGLLALHQASGEVE